MPGYPVSVNDQIQRWADERTRIRCEQIRDLLVSIEDDRASFDDVYAGLTHADCDWQDARSDGPPNLLTKDDLLGVNALIADLAAAMRGHSQIAVALGACVRSVG